MVSLGVSTELPCGLCLHLGREAPRKSEDSFSVYRLLNIRALIIRTPTRRTQIMETAMLAWGPNR